MYISELKVFLLFGEFSLEENILSRTSEGKSVDPLLTEMKLSFRTLSFSNTYETIILLNSIANTTGNKYGGKGTPDRVTNEYRTLLRDILYHELEQAQERLKLLEPKEWLKLLIK